MYGGMAYLLLASVRPRAYHAPRAPYLGVASDGIPAPPSQVRALALLDIAAAARSGSVPSAARPGGSSGPSRGEDGSVGQERPSDARPACRPLFSWEALFPPPEEEDPAGKLRLPSDGELARFAEALKAAARAASARAAERAKAACRAELDARNRLAPGEEALGVMAAASRILSRGADAAAKLLASPAAAPPGDAATVARLPAARAAVLLENLVGSIHGKHLRAFLREEAADARAAGAAPPAASRSSAALDSVEAASAALASAWAEEEAPQGPCAGPESFSWTGVSGGARRPFSFRTCGLMPRHLWAPHLSACHPAPPLPAPVPEPNVPPSRNFSHILAQLSQGDGRTRPLPALHHVRRRAKKLVCFGRRWACCVPSPSPPPLGISLSSSSLS